MGGGGGKSAGGARLSIEAAHYYARIYASARAGCLAELRRAGCPPEEAEDIFAATLERIMRKLDPLSSTYTPAQTVALLKHACRQKLIDERRHRDVLKMVPLDKAGGHPDAAAESPPEAAEEREAVAMGREAISSLPERDRALFFQRHRLGLDPEEILRRNPGLSQRTYRKVMQRANARALRAFDQIGSGERCAELGAKSLRRFATGEASEDEAARVRAHLHHCRACRLAVARSRGALHEVASGLAAVLAMEFTQEGFRAAPIRLYEAIWSGGDALAGATQAARERLRELVLRTATTLPGGSGGEAVSVGQLASISGAKVASACAAGALTVGCLAAGVVPGVGALEIAGSNRHPQRSPNPAISHASRPSTVTTTEPQLAAPSDNQTTKASAGQGESRKEGRSVAVQGATPRARPSPESSSVTSTQPTSSGRQVGTEFGWEAEGTGTPIPSTAGGSSGGSKSSGGEVSVAKDAGKPTRAAAPASAEFGF